MNIGNGLYCTAGLGSQKSAEGFFFRQSTELQRDRSRFGAERQIGDAGIGAYGLEQHSAACAEGKSLAGGKGDRVSGAVKAAGKGSVKKRFGAVLINGDIRRQVIFSVSRKRFQPGVIGNCRPRVVM